MLGDDGEEGFWVSTRGGGSEVVELNGLFEEVRRVGVWSRLVGITLFEVCL